GPVGLESLAVALGEEADTLGEVYEPFLIQNGFLQRTPRGRVASPRAYRRFGYTLPTERSSEQGRLFADG
ncbi:MAG: Holliday junction DNA helicase RuvB C-terminal domain-containing protein, partial [Gemmatimonadota bacterium]